MKRRIAIATTLVAVLVAAASTYAWAGSQGATGSAGSAGGAAASLPNAIQGNFTATGQKQGAITGDGPKGTIILTGVSHEIVSPRDPASGLPTGKRQHKPFTITKELDKSTPLLLQALVTNENLSTVMFHFTQGGGNANISSRTQTGGTEEIAFTYQKITWTWVDGGITTEDSWEAPVA